MDWDGSIDLTIKCLTKFFFLLFFLKGRDCVCQVRSFLHILFCNLSPTCLGSSARSHCHQALGTANHFFLEHSLPFVSSHSALLIFLLAHGSYASFLTLLSSGGPSIFGHSLLSHNYPWLMNTQPIPLVWLSPNCRLSYSMEYSTHTLEYHTPWGQNITPDLFVQLGSSSMMLKIQKWCNHPPSSSCVQLQNHL